MIRPLLAILGVAIGVLIANAEVERNRLYPQPERIEITCIHPKGSGNLVRNARSTSRRGGVNNSTLIQWSMCDEV